MSDDYIDYYSNPEHYPQGYGIRNLQDWFHSMKYLIRERYNAGRPLNAEAVVRVQNRGAVVYSTLDRMRGLGWDPKPAGYFVLSGGEWRYATERELRALGWDPTVSHREVLAGEWRATAPEEETN